MNLFKGCKDGVHKFEARYDKSEAKIPWDRLESFSGSAPVLDRMRSVTYVRDVCVRCGETIERESEVIQLARSA